MMQTSDTIPWSKINGLVDAGFLAFTFGIKRGFSRWNKEYKFFKETIIALDSLFNHRYLIKSDYKYRRKELRISRPELAEKHEIAIAFQNLLREDRRVYAVELLGFEADDILAYLFIKGIGTQSVIASDKDLYQIPGLREVMCRKDGTQTDRALRLPKYHNPPEYPIDFLIAQVLRGDRSDSIPRLLPSKVSVAKYLYTELVGRETNRTIQWQNIISYFGHDAIIDNLFLLLMPSPLLSKQYQGPLNFNDEDPYFSTLSTTGIDRLKVLEKVMDGTYWHPENFYDNFLEVMENSRAKNTEDDWSEYLEDKPSPPTKQRDEWDKLEKEFWSTPWPTKEDEYID